MATKHHLWVAILCVLAPPALATDRLVPSQYATIQAAIDAAVDGDRVVVQPGSYDGFTVTDKSVSVLAAGWNRPCSVGWVKVSSDQLKTRLDISGFVFTGAEWSPFDIVALWMDGYGSDLSGQDVSASFEDCQFFGHVFCFDASGDFNWCDFVGPGIQSESEYSFPVHVYVTGCDFTGGGIAKMPVGGYDDLYVADSAFHGGSVYFSGNSTGPSEIWECRFDQGGSVYCDTAYGALPDQTVSFCHFDDAGIVISDGPLTDIENCTFTHGGYIEVEGYNLDGAITQCSFEDGGTAIHLAGINAALQISDCLFNRNQVGIDVADTGYGVSVDNCTITNSAYEGIRCAGDLTVSNSIIYGNGKDRATYNPTDILVSASGSASLRFSDIGTWSNDDGWIDMAGCIHKDPRFANSQTDFRLISVSPCIDSGNGTVYGVDLLNNPRTVGPRVDMGAYEWQGSAVRLESMSPDNCFAGAKPILQLAGSGFDRGCAIVLNGIPRTTSRPTEYRASTNLAAADTAAPGTYDVYVINPDGETSNHLTFTVTAPVLQAFTLAPATVKGGKTSIGTVTLSAPAPSGGITLAVRSSNLAVAPVPLNVVVPAGSKSATFKVTTKAVGATTAVTITVGALTRTLTVTP